MTSRDIFCLVVRLSGFFPLLFAAYLILTMLVGGTNVGFAPFPVVVTLGLLGVGLMKMAPAIGDVAYGPEVPA